ncbi:sugar nucleotide-binding protein [Marinospirillum insulare]|uniref:dTDP-4-dehydrorhamnose reductase n=1 Tax=Marinospirillum insulare TaxID=217169 RepID=A0ABQ6A3W8_9GAMM|nr:sugar nucleotide-binding protein [Marinospirillum insulare]GLR64799.1 dTDP-4-dehydrorhamnose reductase [Marinospirillum insulare]
MRILLYSDYPALLEALQNESRRYSGLEIIQAHPETEALTLPDFQFMLLAPLGTTAEAGAPSCTSNQLDLWQEKVSALVELCSLRQAQIILISSDLVFSPEQLNISELDSPSNTSLLAKSLLDIESKVAELPKSIILRTAPSLSASCTGGLAQLIARCKAYKPAETLAYRGLQPLDDLARVLLGIILQIDAGAKAWGLYHYAGNEAVTQDELCSTLAGYLNIEDYPKASSSSHKSMSSQHLLDTFGVHPRAWREKLPKLVEQLNEPAKTS